MDEQVIAAMARWPDVPAVYGWLSLTESGHWRLHPQGDALHHPDALGETISSAQILAFINRNYAADALGQWYFQNGPQRVYVRLDAAPFIARTIGDTAGEPGLRTHTGRDILQVNALYLDDTGRLYLATEHGAALVAGRDLPALADALQVAAQHGNPQADLHASLARCLETGKAVQLPTPGLRGFSAMTVLHYSHRHTLEAALQFRRLPHLPDQPTPSTSQESGKHAC